MNQGFCDMRILLAALMVAFAALIGAPARAADLPDYPDVQVPEVDYGLQGGFYLRGSVGGNLMWAQEHISTCGCFGVATGAGYGYSVGAGFGYEAGNGLRVDGTLDYLQNDNLTDGNYSLHLKGAVALANVYYDFPLSGSGSAGGGFGAYVGAGAGATFYNASVTADLGYRMLYLPKISNYSTLPNDTYYVNDSTIHEVRGTLRYRFH